MTVPHEPTERAASPTGDLHHAPAGSAADAAPAASATTAPPVVVVVVAHDPGWWFEDTLVSIAGQDYPNTSVLVVDAASRDADGLRSRVAGVLPSAHLRRLEVNPGFGAAANEAIKAVQGAAFHLLCHDDVRLAPDAVRLMVEEAFRSNAGIVGPKVVDWHDERRLLHVGMGADRFGHPSPYVERGDLDQAQHDAVRDAFYIPGAATLVRSDLFDALQGFDPVITLHGEDLDLCWRAHLAGARVVVAPAARVAHLEALGARRPVDDRRRLQTRHRQRTVRMADRPLTRLRVLPELFLFNLVEVLHAVLRGRFRHARDVASAWTWNLRHRGSLRRRRRLLNAIRQVPDSEARALQVRGSARLAGYLRGQLGRTPGSARDAVSNLREARATTSLVVWALVLVALVVGSREVLFGNLPEIGALASFDPPGQMLRAWVSGYDASGLGSTAPNATGIGVFGLLSTLLLGASGLLRTIVVLAPLVLGPLGVWRLAGPVGSRRGRLVATVAYALVPVGTNALSTGRWAGVVAYGLAPWVVSVLASTSGVAPFGDKGGSAGPGVRTRPLVQRIVAVGVIVAAGAVIDASLLFVLPLCGLALVVGGLLAGQLSGAVRVLVATVGGTVVAVVLHLPWSLSFVDGWSALVAPVSTGGQALDLGAVLRFQTGPFGAGFLGWALLVTAFLPLLIGRRWRLAWAVRGWALAASGFALSWVVAEGWVGLDAPAPEIWLAPAAVGVALAAGLGMVAFEVDLPDYHFGWRQIVSLLSGAAFLLAFLPALNSVVSGRWELPGSDYDRALSFLRTEADDQPFRALWLGDAAVLPGVGWELEAPGIDELGPNRTLTYLTTEQGVPSLLEHWPGAEGDATARLADAVRAAADGDTARLGALLAPMGVRYVVVPLAPAPFPQGESRRYDPADLLATLEAQLDLDSLTVNPGARVYENAAWGPSRALLPADTAIPGDDLAVTARTLPPLADAPPVLAEGEGVTERTGPVDRPGTVYLAAAGGDRWSLEVDGQVVPRTDAFGWASAFDVDQPGQGRLSFDTPITRWLALLGQVALWALAIIYLLRVRVVEDERDTLPVEGPVAPAHVVVTPEATEGARTGRRRASAGARRAAGSSTGVRVMDAPVVASSDEGDDVDGDPADEVAPADAPTMAVPAITIEAPTATGRRPRRRRGRDER